MMPSLPSDSRSPQRLITLDILRGFALSGILFVHIIFWYTAGPLPKHVFTNVQDTPSHIVDFISNYFWTGKFFAFFSFLFGMSFYIQMKNMEQKGVNFVRRYSWRLFLLFVIGAVHSILWMGDILAVYAILGFVLLLMRKLSDKTILIIGLILASNIMSKVIVAAVHFLADNQDQASADHPAAERYYSMIVDGGWKEMIDFNLFIVPDRVKFQLFSGRVFMTLGYFLLGIYMGRGNGLPVSALNLFLSKYLKVALRLFYLPSW